MNNVTKAGSMDDEDLNDSVDFDFYESNDQESMNTVFNKVYCKPPPGRHRHFHTCSQEKVCYDSFCSSSAASEEPFQYVNGCLNDCDLDKMKGAVDLIEDKNERILTTPTTTTTTSTTTTPTIEDCTLLADENDTQSSLDVSISDDTESNISDLPDFSDEENGKESSSFANQLRGSKPAGDTRSNPNKQCAIKTENQRNTVPFKNSKSTDCVVAESGPSDTDLSSIDGDDDDVAEDDDDDDDDDDIDDDDVDDDDDSLASVEDNSEDEDECNVDSTSTDSHLKTLGNGKASQPQAILRKNVGITLAERFSLQQKTHAKRNGYSQSSNRSDLNCNTFESDCSSASEMTDVSPLASGDSSPTMVRRCKSAPSQTSSSPPFCEQNGLCTATDQNNSNMDMNLIMRAVEEIGKEEYSTRDSSPIRKKNQRTNLSYNTFKTREIERENERLLSEILKLSSNKSYKNTKKLPIKTKVAHSAINRQREQRRIERENEAFLRRLESVKPSKGLSREEQLAEYSSKHPKYSLKVAYPGFTTKRPSTASTECRSFVNIDSTTDLPAKKELNCRSKTKFKNRPEWISKW